MVALAVHGFEWFLRTASGDGVDVGVEGGKQTVLSRDNVSLYLNVSLVNTHINSENACIVQVRGWNF